MPRRSVLLAFVGVGNALIDVAGFTLLARMAPDEVLARVFGVLESLVAVSIGIGAIVAAWAVDACGYASRAGRHRSRCAPCWPRRRGGGCVHSTASVGVRDDDVGLLQRVPMLRRPPAARHRAARSRAGAGRRRCG